MSEAMILPPLDDAEPKRTPTVYFIDDSATMREVIKIAFRRESFNVIACADAASAIIQFDQNPPDVVITDVIMPDQDGYSVCTQVKNHPQFSGTPVILMSGVVNKSVADRAVSVKADELIRKPFQPQELISRVKSLLDPKPTSAAAAHDRQTPSSALSGLFAPPPAPVRVSPPAQAAPPLSEHQKTPDSVWPRALAEAFLQQTSSGAALPQNANAAAQPPARPAATNHEVAKLRGEIARLEHLVKKLQTELQLEKQYTQALESQVKTLNESE
jgi:DNA-binding response OmpR family regulator